MNVTVLGILHKWNPIPLFCLVGADNGELFQPDLLFLECPFPRYSSSSLPGSLFHGFSFMRHTLTTLLQIVIWRATFLACLTFFFGLIFLLNAYHHLTNHLIYCLHLPTKMYIQEGRNVPVSFTAIIVSCTITMHQFSSVQSLSHVRLFVTP